MYSRLLYTSVIFAAGVFGASAGTAATEVKVVHPQKGDVVRYITLPGSIRANQQVILYAKVPGYLRAILVDKGDAVKANQVLAEIESPELVSQAAKYRAELKLAEVNQQRVESARAKSPDLVTGQVLDQASGQLDVAKANLEGTEMLLRYTKVTAPFDGVITMRFVDPGAYVPAATAGAAPASAAIVTVMDVSTVRIQTSVPESDASLAKAGQPLTFSVEGMPGRTFEAKVTRVSGALEEATRTMALEADFGNAEHLLMPGMYASVKVGVEKHTGVTWIPAEALVMEKTAAFAFVVDNGQAKKTAIGIGFNDGKRVEVVQGLKPEDNVILVGKLVLSPGQAVTVASTP